MAPRQSASAGGPHADVGQPGTPGSPGTPGGGGTPGAQFGEFIGATYVAAGAGTGDGGTDGGGGGGGGADASMPANITYYGTWGFRQGSTDYDFKDDCGLAVEATDAAGSGSGSAAP